MICLKITFLERLYLTQPPYGLAKDVASNCLSRPGRGRPGQKRKEKVFLDGSVRQGSILVDRQRSILISPPHARSRLPGPDRGFPCHSAKNQGKQVFPLGPHARTPLSL